jgi:tellurite methyltransferase
LSNETQRETTWSDYYAANDDRPPREFLVAALRRFPSPGRAIDVGCGAGIDTLAMLERGWNVFAFDAEPEAIDRLRARVPLALAARLRTEVASMEDVQLPPADLGWASFSLFFCDPDRFEGVWARVRTSVSGGGRFAGQILGDRDSWAGNEGITSFDRDAARLLFDGWTIERFVEDEEDGEACSGPKHWHVFSVVARLDATRRS